MMKNGRVVFALFFLLMVLLFVILAPSYPGTAKAAPLALGIPAALMALLHVMAEVRQTTSSALSEGEQKHNFTVALKEKRMIAWVVGFVVLIYFVGMIAAVPLFIVGFMRLNGETWLLSGLVAAVSWSIVYFVFAHVLELVLFPGVLWLIFVP